ncbi:MAG: hypothetical protein WAS72_10850 [Saprospiraceae bacterium]
MIRSEKMKGGILWLISSFVINQPKCNCHRYDGFEPDLQQRHR